MTRRLKVLHIITSLGLGGAETFLYTLLRNMAGSIDAQVISLTDTEPTGAKLRSVGVPVKTVNMTRGLDVSAIARLCAMIKEAKPDLIQTWLHHADLIGGIAGFMAGTPVIWGLRGEAYTRSTRHTFKPSTILTINLCAALSYIVPRRIISCATSSATTHINVGYKAQSMQVISNGVDVDYFTPNAELGSLQRTRLGLSTQRLVTMIGRSHPQKNQVAFIEMAEIIAKHNNNVTFLLAGPDILDGRGPVVERVSNSSICDRIFLLDAQSDIRPLLCASSVVVCPSLTEAFPNVIAEAMACGVPCVGTDVGEMRQIIGDAGIVTQGSSPLELATGVLELLELSAKERENLKERARSRICENFDISLASRTYALAYKEVFERRAWRSA